MQHVVRIRPTTTILARARSAISDQPGALECSISEPPVRSFVCRLVHSTVSTGLQTRDAQPSLSSSTPRSCIRSTSARNGGNVHKSLSFTQPLVLLFSKIACARTNFSLAACEEHAEFRAFVRACEHQEACHGLDLRAYLIQPVQRVPRYRLLLIELLKHTRESHPDWADLNAALENVRNRFYRYPRSSLASYVVGTETSSRVQ